ERRERVDDELYAVRRGPRAHLVTHDTGRERLAAQGPCDPEPAYGSGGGRRPRQAAAAQQECERRNGKRHHDLQHREMRRERVHSRSISRMAGSSIVPYASRMRTTIASPSASVAMPTTMAVKISTCGTGFE